MRFTHPPEQLARLPQALLPMASEVNPRRLKICLDLMDARLPNITVLSEGVHRRHNISAILRSAEAFGVHEAHVVPGLQASRGASKGAERWLALHHHPDVQAAHAHLAARGFRLYVADLADDALPPEQIPLDRPVALLVGAELTGVSDAARALADGVVSIPMVGVTRSLNVSAAASVVLHAVCRRARAAGPVGVHGAARGAFIERFMRREIGRRKATEHLFQED
jgi:tRNA (guanosine-2'-O-)-methyltransferase